MATFDFYLTGLIRELRTAGRSPLTIEKYVEILRRMDRELPAGLVRANTDELVDWIWGPAGRKPATLDLYRTIVAAFFRHATDEVALADRRLNLDPSRYLPRVRRPRGTPRPAGQDQLADILARAREPQRGWYAIAAGAGLRCIDLSNLDREDCTAESIYVLGKGGRVRTVWMHPRLWPIIEPLPAGPICRTLDGRRASAKSIQQRGNDHLRALGYRHVTMHKLRHYFGTEIHDAADGDILVAQNQLGHSSPNTTQIYVLVQRRKAQAAVARIPLPV